MLLPGRRSYTRKAVEVRRQKKQNPTKANDPRARSARRKHEERQQNAGERFARVARKTILPATKNCGRLFNIHAFPSCGNKTSVGGDKACFRPQHLVCSCQLNSRQTAQISILYTHNSSQNRKTTNNAPQSCFRARYMLVC